MSPTCACPFLFIFKSTLLGRLTRLSKPTSLNADASSNRSFLNTSHLALIPDHYTQITFKVTNLK